MGWGSWDRGQHDLSVQSHRYGGGGFIGRHLINEALHLILALPTCCVKIVHTQWFCLLYPWVGIVCWTKRRDLIALFLSVKTLMLYSSLTVILLLQSLGAKFVSQYSLKVKPLRLFFMGIMCLHLRNHLITVIVTKWYSLAHTRFLKPILIEVITRRPCQRGCS